MTISFRKPHRQQLADNAKAMEHYEKLYGATAGGQEHRAQIRAEVDSRDAKAAARKPRTATSKPLESPVQKAIIDYLLPHPKVALVIRFNSGGVRDGDAYFRFHTIYRPARYRDKRLRLVDVIAWLVDGRTLAIEVKRPGWRQPVNAREIEQAHFLAHVREMGGVGLFATCIEDVQAALTGGGY